MPDLEFNYVEFLRYPRYKDKDPKEVIAEQFSTTADPEEFKAALKEYGQYVGGIDPDSVWVKDTAMREDRAKVSEQVRGEMAGLLRQNLDLSNTAASQYERLILLTLRGKPEEYQQRMESLKEVPEGQAPERESYEKEERERFVQSFHNLTKGMSPSSIRSMSDRQLADSFQVLAMLASIKERGESFFSDLPEEQRSSINGFFNRCGGALDEAMWRAETIASPYYQYCDTDRFPPADYGKEELDEVYSGEFFETDEIIFKENNLSSEESSAFELFCFRSQKCSQLKEERHQDKVLDAVEKHHKSLVTASPEEVSPQNIKWYGERGSYTGEYTAPQPVVEELRSGKTVYALMPDATVMAVSGSEKADGLLSAQARTGSADEIVNLKRLAMQKTMKRLADEISNVHPWYKFSSNQFKEMKSAFKAVQDGLKTMGENPTEQQRREMQEKLTALSEKCQSYREYKKGRTGNYTNVMRMQVSDHIKEAAESFKSILDMHDQVDQLKQQRVEERRARHEAWQEKVQEGFAKQREDAEEFKNREPAPNKMKAKTDMAVMYKKCAGWVGGSDPESDCGKTVENLRKEALGGVPYLVDGAGLPGALSDRQRGLLGKRVATFVAYEMIQQERGDHFKGQAGPLEQQCAKNQEAFINMVQRSPAFEHSVGELTPQRLERFIMEDGARKIATEIFRQAAARTPETRQSKPQPGVQKKAEGPQKQM